MSTFACSHFLGTSNLAMLIRSGMIVYLTSFSCIHTGPLRYASAARRAAVPKDSSRPFPMLLFPKQSGGKSMRLMHVWGIRTCVWDLTSLSARALTYLPRVFSTHRALPLFLTFSFSNSTVSARSDKTKPGSLWQQIRTRLE